MSDFTLTDYYDQTIEVGTTVRIWDDEKCDLGFGTVTDLGEWDGDVDDEGVGIPPRIKVQFVDGIEIFPTSEWEFEHTGYYEREPVEGKVEEVTVVAMPIRKETS